MQKPGHFAQPLTRYAAAAPLLATGERDQEAAILAAMCPQVGLRRPGWGAVELPPRGDSATIAPTQEIKRPQFLRRCAPKSGPGWGWQLNCHPGATVQLSPQRKTPSESGRCTICPQVGLRRRGVSAKGTVGFAARPPLLGPAVPVRRRIGRASRQAMARSRRCTKRPERDAAARRLPRRRR